MKKRQEKVKWRAAALTPLTLCFLAVVLCLPPPSWGWNTDPTENVSVLTGVNSGPPHLVPDTFGGAFITAGSNDGPASTGINTQRLDGNGSIHTGWPAGGALQSVAGQELSVAVSDGAGGTIVVWEDYGNDPTGVAGDILAQRYDATGKALWAAGGVSVCVTTDDQGFPQAVSDGAGGAVVVWQDLRNGANYHVYAQRINSGGVSLWTPNGVQLAAALSTNEQLNPHLVADGSGGAIVAWENLAADYDIYARRVDGSGTLVGAPVNLSAASNDQLNPRLVGDGTASPNGAIVVWEDYSNVATGNLTANIMAQRIGANAVPAWGAGGVAVFPSPDDQQSPQVVTDGAGGAIVAWEDDNGTGVFDPIGGTVSGSTYQLYTQRILAADGSFDPAWSTLSPTEAGFDQRDLQMMADGAGGAILVWEDFRSNNGYEIFAQRVDNAGFPLWPTAGLPADVPVSTQAGGAAPYDKLNPQLVSDDAGGAIVAWDDSRSGLSSDVYAQRIDGDGTLSSFSTPSGACGSADGQTLTTVPTNTGTTLCLTGTATAVSGSGPWSWSCNGFNAGTNASCGANIQTFPLSVTAGANGTVNGGGSVSQTVNYGSRPVLTATPATGYNFVNWTDGAGAVASTANPYTLPAVTGAVTLTANFNIQSFTVSAAGGANGTVNGVANFSQSVTYGTQPVLTALATTAGYHFVKWTDGTGTAVSTANPYTLPAVTGTVTLTANFSNTFTVSAAGGANGTVNGAANFSQSAAFGAQPVLTASATSAGYYFTNWTDGAGAVVSSANPYTLPAVSGDVTLTANFANSYTVSAAGGARGTVNGAANFSQTVSFGAQPVLTALATVDGYYFVNWTDGAGSVVSSANPYTLPAVSGAVTLTANFSNNYTVTFASGANGSITGNTSQSVPYGSACTQVSAVAAAGYHFVEWTSGTTQVGTNANLTLSGVSGHQTVTASFVPLDGLLVPAAGKVKPDVTDALMCLKMAVNLVTPTAVQRAHADAAPLDSTGKPKGDGAIGVDDALVLLKMAVGLM